MIENSNFNHEFNSIKIIKMQVLSWPQGPLKIVGVLVHLELYCLELYNMLTSGSWFFLMR